MADVNPFYTFPVDRRELQTLLDNGNLFPFIKKLYRYFVRELNSDQGRGQDYTEQFGLEADELVKAMHVAYGQIEDAHDTNPAQLRAWVEGYGTFMGMDETQLGQFVGGLDIVIKGLEEQVTDLNTQLDAALDGQPVHSGSGRVRELERELREAQSESSHYQRMYETMKEATERADELRQAAEEAARTFQRDYQTTEEARRREAARAQAAEKSLEEANTATAAVRRTLKATRENAAREQAGMQSALDAAEQLVRSQAGKVTEAMKGGLEKTPIGPLVESLLEQYKINEDQWVLDTLTATARAWAQEGLAGGAAQIYRLILDTDPSQSATRMAYIGVLEKLNRKTDAISELEVEISRRGGDDRLEARKIQLTLREYYADLIKEGFEDYSSMGMAQEFHTIFKRSPTFRRARYDAIMAMLDHGIVKDRKKAKALAERVTEDVYSPESSQYRIEKILEGNNDALERGYTRHRDIPTIARVVKAVFDKGTSSGAIRDKLNSKWERLGRVKSHSVLTQLTDTLMEEAYSVTAGYDPSTHLAHARRAFKTGDFESVLYHGLNAQIIAQRAGNERVLKTAALLLGKSHQELGENYLAREAYQDYLKHDPGNVNVERRLTAVSS